MTQPIAIPHFVRIALEAIDPEGTYQPQPQGTQTVRPTFTVETFLSSLNASEKQILRDRLGIACFSEILEEDLPHIPDDRIEEAVDALASHFDLWTGPDYPTVEDCNTEALKAVLLECYEGSTCLAYYPKAGSSLRIGLEKLLGRPVPVHPEEL